MKSKLKFLATGALGLALLVGCAPGPRLRVMTELANGGTYEIGPEMRNRHMIAVFGFDEGFPAKAARVTQSTFYLQGIVEGTPEYLYRVVQLNMGQLKGAGWYEDGEHLWITGALVPDHIPRLRAYDVVEFRQVSGNRSMENFSKTGEGNVIVKVHCRKVDPDWEKCHKALPQGKFGPQGDTGIPYPASVKGYGFTFTPAYDATGKPTRAIPEYQPPR